MLTARRFWYNLSGTVLAVGMQFFIVGLFFVGYMPTIGRQPIDQQITIVGALVSAAAAFAVEIAVIVSSIMYERPSQQRED